MANPVESQPCVRQFRQILLWPLQLMPIHDDAVIQNHWELLQSDKAGNPWQEVQDEFTSDEAEFKQRHYNEFVAFLPYVQRMLYGEGKGCGSAAGESPIRVFRRQDVAAVRLHYPGADSEPITLALTHVDLYFFYDLDVTILVVELSARDLELSRVQETMFRFGRAYPTYWNDDGSAGHCLKRVEWLDAGGEVLSTSDYENQEKYLKYVCRYRAPCISSHWEYLLQPMVLHHSDAPGVIRYRLVEYHRMPACAYLSFDDPRQLSRADFLRLGLLTPPGRADVLPVPERQAQEFEERHCYDRFWNPQGAGSPGIRSMCTGETFVMVGSEAERGYPSGGPIFEELFRHQFFLLFLISHLHKSSLFMLSDRLLHALNRLDIGNAPSVRTFKRDIRRLKENFLRFTHRYWFHELSDQLQAKALYRMFREHMGTERMYAEVRDEIEEMNEYLDSDSLRRQANMVIRLTVVTIFGLIGTVATGFLGMNLIAAADSPLPMRVLYFLLAFVPTVALTFYTIIKSKKLSDFLDALSDEGLPLKAKAGALLAVWRKSDPG